METADRDDAPSAGSAADPSSELATLEAPSMAPPPASVSAPPLLPTSGPPPPPRPPPGPPPPPPSTAAVAPDDSTGGRAVPAESGADGNGGAPGGGAGASDLAWKGQRNRMLLSKMLDLETPVQLRVNIPLKVKMTSFYITSITLLIYRVKILSNELSNNGNT